MGEAIPTKPMTSDQAERLIVAADRNTESNDRFSTAMVTLQERERKAKRRFWTTIAVVVTTFLTVMAGLIIVLTYILVSISEIQNANEAASGARDQIISCTTPSGQCYQESQKRSTDVIGQAIQSFITSEINVAACSNEAPDSTPPVRRAAIASCITGLSTR